jgi:hypothetical protein
MEGGSPDIYKNSIFARLYASNLQFASLIGTMLVNPFNFTLRFNISKLSGRASIAITFPFGPTRFELNIV